MGAGLHARAVLCLQVTAATGGTEGVGERNLSGLPHPSRGIKGAALLFRSAPGC